MGRGDQLYQDAKDAFVSGNVLAMGIGAAVGGAVALFAAPGAIVFGAPITVTGIVLATVGGALSGAGVGAIVNKGIDWATDLATGHGADPDDGKYHKVEDVDATEDVSAIAADPTDMHNPEELGGLDVNGESELTFAPEVIERSDGQPADYHYYPGMILDAPKGVSGDAQQQNMRGEDMVDGGFLKSLGNKLDNSQDPVHSYDQAQGGDSFLRDLGDLMETSEGSSPTPDASNQTPPNPNNSGGDSTLELWGNESLEQQGIPPDLTQDVSPLTAGKDAPIFHASDLIDKGTADVEKPFFHAADSHEHTHATDLGMHDLTNQSVLSKPDLQQDVFGNDLAKHPPLYDSHDDSTRAKGYEKAPFSGEEHGTLANLASAFDHSASPQHDVGGFKDPVHKPAPDHIDHTHHEGGGHAGPGSHISHGPH